MKKIFFSCILSIALLSSLSAYELDGNLGVKWTGFKTEKKVPVSGTFNDIKLDIKSSESLSTFLRSSSVSIKTASFESKNPSRNESIVSTLFSLSTAKTITGKILDVDEINKKLILEVTMNEVAKPISMEYEISENKILAKGTIDILDFDMKSSFMAFAKKCAVFHENKSFSDVNIEFTIPYK